MNKQLPCRMCLCLESPALDTRPLHWLVQGLSLLPPHPTGLDFFFISLLLQPGWQEVNGLLAQQSLLPLQRAAWPDRQHPLSRQGEMLLLTDPLLTFCHGPGWGCHISAEHRDIALLPPLDASLAKPHCFLPKKGLKAEQGCQKSRT